MVEITAMTYEQVRSKYFEEQMQKAQRRMKYWEARIDRTRPDNLMDEAHGKAADAGWEYNFYKDALEALAAQPKWISVKEQLPKQFVSVLVYMPDEYPRPTVREGYLSSAGYWEAAHYLRNPDEVTHWAYMPEPPKENA